MQNSHTHFDYIICGGGMAGLSLAYHLSLSKLSHSKILIIDPEKKTKNDRTWAFWENSSSPFESILAKNWKSINIVNSKGQKKLYDLKSYSYKLIRGIDFYTFVYEHLKQFSNITFHYGLVNQIEQTGNTMKVVATNNVEFSADYIFDSTFKLNLSNHKNLNLLQHFKGLVLESETEIFEEGAPEMMNFSIEQKPHQGRFMYILPFSKTKALVEFTVFSENLLTEKEYNIPLENYLKQNYKNHSFKISEEEYGVIPMSDVAIDEYPSNRHVRIGTSGGYTNPATGYTFANTQKRLIKMVQKMEKTGSPVLLTHWFDKRHKLYASTLLNVIKKNRYPMAETFDRIFSKNDIESVFRFLDNESSLWDELKIMWSTPKLKFGVAFIDVYLKHLKK